MAAWQTTLQAGVNENAADLASYRTINHNESTEHYWKMENRKSLCSRLPALAHWRQIEGDPGLHDLSNIRKPGSPFLYRTLQHSLSREMETPAGNNPPAQPRGWKEWALPLDSKAAGGLQPHHTTHSPLPVLSQSLPVERQRRGLTVLPIIYSPENYFSPQVESSINQHQVQH
jgi:hypothetical protein